eukprot:TRINITY_DN4965_c0_g1_i4.p1 TRINITY_DN4965_c0_g1~~TRINITY_DN4965_c0_g1_i4.p1  ORF type:complete len:336 (-),score=65.39 TRINITY_DN4965_c0_g1_i4:11-1018(-)
MYMSACQDYAIRIYDTRSQNWKLKNSIVARDVGWSIISTDYSPDKDWLIYSSWSDYVHLCNTSGEKEVHEPLDFQSEAHRFCLFSIQFSPNSTGILGGSSDRHLYLYDIVQKRRTHKVSGHANDINAVRYADKGSQIFFSGSDDALIKIWDARTLDSRSGKCEGVLTGHREGVTFIDSKGDGIHLISNGKDQTIKLWDIRKMKEPSAAQTRPTYQSSFDYRDTWRTRRQMVPKRTSDDCSLMTYTGHKVFQTLIRCRFSPLATTGQKYIYTGSFDGTVYIFDLITGKLVSTLTGHRLTVRDVDWHPYQPIIVSTSWDGTVKKWSYKEEPPKEENF